MRLYDFILLEVMNQCLNGVYVPLVFKSFKKYMKLIYLLQTILAHCCISL